MKKHIMIVISLILLMMILFSGCIIPESVESKNNKATDSDNGIHRIEIYHFYQAPECFPCKTAGEYAEEAVHTYFSDELESGKIVFQNIDMTLDGNKALMNKFNVKPGFSGIYYGIYSEDFETAEYNYMMYLEDKEKWMQEFREFIREELNKAQK